MSILQASARRGENPVINEVARVELGRPGPPLSPTFYSALKKKMGLSRKRFVFLSVLQKWRVENPEFKESDVYHRGGCGCGECLDKKKHQAECCCNSCRCRRARAVRTKKARLHTLTGPPDSTSRKSGEPL